MAKPKGGEPTLPLSAEVRRQRVEAVRGLDGELRTVESMLLDAQARIPGLIARVRGARSVIQDSTSPAKAGDVGTGDMGD